MNEMAKAFILGIIEGLTEFLPVSSTGHLILVGKLLKFEGGFADTFSVFIQLGAILAVLVLYRVKFLNLFDFKARSGFSGISGIVKLGLATLPALVFGLIAYKFIKSYLFNSTTVALGLIIGGLVLVKIESWLKKGIKVSEGELSYLDCLKIGSFQCLALCPGVSRSGSTIVGAMLLGCEKKLAAEFSFFLAVPTMFAAVGYDLYKSWGSLHSEHFPILAVGFIVSFVVAVLAIKFFIALLNRFSLKPFGYYRIMIGVLILIFI